MKTNLTTFAEYVWSFYGPNKIHGDFFGHTLTKAELLLAVNERAKSPHFDGDSIDREAVRDLMTFHRKVA